MSDQDPEPQHVNVQAEPVAATAAPPGPEDQDTTGQEEGEDNGVD